MKSWMGLAVVSLLILVGCASAPSPEIMQADIVGYSLPITVNPERAVVVVTRPSSLGTLIRFNVFLDDQEENSEMGYTRGAEYIWFHVAPGDHMISSKAENWAQVMIKANAGDTVFIHQEPSMGFIMARNTLQQIQNYQGVYEVKHTTQGTILRSEK